LSLSTPPPPLPYTQTRPAVYSPPGQRTHLRARADHVRNPRAGRPGRPPVPRAACLPLLSPQLSHRPRLLGGCLRRRRPGRPLVLPRRPPAAALGPRLVARRPGGRHRSRLALSAIALGGPRPGRQPRPLRRPRRRLRGSLPRRLVPQAA